MSADFEAALVNAFAGPSDKVRASRATASVRVRVRVGNRVRVRVRVRVRATLSV